MSYAFDESIPNIGLLSRERKKNGPLQSLWNQDEWIPPTTRDGEERHDLTLKEMPRQPKALERLLRWKPYYMYVRIAPPEGEDLQTWGTEVANTLGLPLTDYHEGDKAVWLTGGVWASNAVRALQSSSHFFFKLGHIQASGVQVRVGRFDV